MIQERRRHRVLVTGATGFLGYRVVVALLEIDAQVAVLVRPDRQESLVPLRDRIQILHGDVWNRASLKGRARGHSAIVHLVGSARADPERGLTFSQINLVSARNVTGMAVSDGVPLVLLLSTVTRPGDLPGAYVRSKRDAEVYLRNSGLEWTIVRAPALYAPQRSLSLRMLGALGGLFPVNLLFGNMMPLSVDVAARGIAAMVASDAMFRNRVVYARHLRLAAWQTQYRSPLQRPQYVTDPDPEGLDEPPFGWFPPR